MKRLVYLVAVSLDGFIAGPGGDFTPLMMDGGHLSELAARTRRPFPPRTAPRSASPPTTRSSTPC